MPSGRRQQGNKKAAGDIFCQIYDKKGRWLRIAYFMLIRNVCKTMREYKVLNNPSLLCGYGI